MTALTIYVLSLVAIALYVRWIGIRNARIANYNFMYINLATMLRDPLRPVNLVSFKELGGHFKELEELPYKNDEKTEVLTEEFLKKYQDVRDEIDREYKELLSEDEFSVEVIFGGE